jgi:WD40 repeat protein
VLTGHSGWVSSVGLSADARSVASGSLDRSIKVWDVDTGLIRASSGSYPGPVTCIAFLEDAGIVLVGGYDGSIRAWTFNDVASGIRELGSHTGTVWYIAKCDNGKLVASASGDGSAKLWSTDVVGGSDLFSSSRPATACALVFNGGRGISAADLFAVVGQRMGGMEFLRIPAR